MNAAEYEIILQTPLGPREGHLILAPAGTVLQGSLQVMGHSNPFTGICDTEGNCSFSGLLHTLVRDIPYTAQGQITSTDLCVKLQTDRSIFTLLRKEVSKEIH